MKTWPDSPPNQLQNDKEVQEQGELRQKETKQYQKINQKLREEKDKQEIDKHKRNKEGRRYYQRDHHHRHHHNANQQRRHTKREYNRHRSRSYQRRQHHRHHHHSRYQKEEKPKKQQTRESKKIIPLTEQQKLVEKLPEETKKTPTVQSLITRSGGVYIPPHKLAKMQHAIQAEGPQSVAYQKYMFENLRKSINGIINKVNTNNIQNVLFELFHQNLLRGKGLFCRAVMKAQMASPNFTHIYAALLAVVNTKLPDIARLLINRTVLQFQKAFRYNNKIVLTAACKMIAHLVNQQVINELIALQILVLFLQEPTQDSVEVAADFMRECGQVLTDLTPGGVNSIFQRFRGILHEGQIDRRVQYTIESLFAVRKSKFKDYVGVIPELDLVQEQDKITHNISLDQGDQQEGFEAQTELDFFKFDKQWKQSQQQWGEIRKQILGEEEVSAVKRKKKRQQLIQASGEDLTGDAALQANQDFGEEDEEDQEDIGLIEQQQQGQEQDDTNKIHDMTEQDLKNLRRVIYINIMSSVDFQQACHKLMKLNIRQGQQIELCNMIMQCCMQERTYLRFYGLLAQRFAILQPKYQIIFQQQCFPKQYETIHRLQTNMIRNLSKFFAHLLYTEAIQWSVMKSVRLTQQDTTSSSRIFIKILFQELSGQFGLKALSEKLKEQDVKENISGLFPRDTLTNVRFSINFFSSIELGIITEDQRQFLEQWPKLLLARKIQRIKQQMEEAGNQSSSGSSSENEQQQAQN